MSQLYVHPGEVVIVNRPALLTSVLGSCVAVCAWDKCSGVAGMNHFMLPQSLEHASTPYYGDIAVSELLDRMVAMGAVTSRIRALVAGGGMHPLLGPHVPEQNLRIAKQVLRHRRIYVLQYDVGGEWCRRVAFDTGAPAIAITKGGECIVTNIARY